MPAFHWVEGQSAKVVCQAFDDSLQVATSSESAYHQLTKLTSQEAAQVRYYDHRMLFIWHSPLFAAWYAMEVNPKLPTNSQRFCAIVATLFDKFKTAKSHHF